MYDFYYECRVYQAGTAGLGCRDLGCAANHTYSHRPGRPSWGHFWKEFIVSAHGDIYL